MTFRIDTSEARRGMRAKATAVHFAAAVAVQTAANNAADNARRTKEWKDKSGKTRESIQAVEKSSYKYEVRAGGAAVFLEFGTGKFGRRGSAYPIPESGSANLRFVVNGKVMFRRHVMHPGIKPTSFMRDAAERERYVFADLLSRFIKSAVARTG